jgi:hypothetical protein
MGFIYKIEIDNQIYIGSTKQKLLCQRQADHNRDLNNPNSKNYNNPLYKFCREHNVSKIICELIETVEDNELKILEQGFINLLEPTLNSQRAYRTEEERIEQIKLNNNKKSKCPICDKLITKKYIKTHIKNIHK